MKLSETIASTLNRFLNLGLLNKYLAFIIQIDHSHAHTFYSELALI